MVTITDTFRIGIMASESCTYRTVGTMRKSCHTIVGMGEAFGTVG